MTRDEAITKRDWMTRENGMPHIAYQVIPATTGERRTLLRVGHYAASTPELADKLFGDIIIVEAP